MARSTTAPSALLDALKLDRDAPPAGNGHGGRLLIAALLAAALAGAAGGVLVFGTDAPAADTPAAASASGETAAPLRPAGRTGTPAGEPQAPDPLPASVLDATGYVVARLQATVSAKTTGKVREILVEEGMPVRKGQVIARLDDSVERAELALALAQVDAARSAVGELDTEIRYARRRLERTRSLAARSLASQADLDDRTLAARTLAARRDQARTEVTVAERRVAVQRQRLADMEIRAPFAGVVVDKAAQPGEMVSPVSAGGGFTRTGLGTIVDMNSLEVDVDVNEAYINRVHAGQRALVTLNAYPDRNYPAHVLTIVPTADRAKATVSVRVGLTGLDDRVLPDMGVRVAFLAPTDQPQETAHETHGPL